MGPSPVLVLGSRLFGRRAGRAVVQAMWASMASGLSVAPSVGDVAAVFGGVPSYAPGCR